jgi:septation ring formation regulator EzrA
MEFLIALAIIVVVVLVAVRLRKTFSQEINRAKRIKRANDNHR